MELLAAPLRHFKTHVPRLLPVLLGVGAGFLGVANLLAFFLKRYPDPSVCLFVGLIAGMMPALWRQAGEQGRGKGSYAALFTAMAALLLLLGGLSAASVTIAPNFGWYLFCGFCLALSVIAPGMSFSTLLMPLGLYTPFIDGIGRFDLGVLLPGGLGALVTVVCLAKAVDGLFKRYYSIAFHAIVGVVVAATLMVVPYGAFAASVGSCLVCLACLAAGVGASLLLDRFNSSVPEPEE